MPTDWSDPNSLVTPNFTVREACWLPTWGQLHNPTPDEQTNLLGTFELLEKVRAVFGKPVRVHVAVRPAAYNTQIGGAPNSAHITGQAVDFDIVGMSCDDVRAALATKLEELGARMERRPGSLWIHLDTRNPGVGNRYFNP